MFKNIIISIICLFYFYSCAPSQSFISYISFDKVYYPPTQKENIKILKSRLELNVPYKEIGVIKLEGEPKIEDVVTMAAEHGALAIIKEGNNYILMIYKNGNNDEKYKTI